ncbi:hypothetical protein PV326_012554 [Microctonus aethiopoides]|nr:hypothetical protein PV326_012554 [Microctonus aethiopoides]
MFDILGTLRRQNQGLISRCWLAATLSEIGFKKICKANELNDFNVVLASEDIMNLINHKKINLYTSSQLAFGLLKIQLYKTSALDAYMKNVQNALRPVDLKKLQTKQEKLETIPNVILDLPELDVTVKFKKQLEKPDRHLLPEYGQYDASFSVIQDDEFEKREFDLLTIDDLTAQLKEFFPTEAEITDESREHLRETSAVTRQPLSNLDITNLPNGNDPRTPSKRKGRSIDLNTPSKRHRRNSLFPLEDQENVPPAKIPNADKSYDLQENMDNDPPMPSLDDSNIQASGQTHSLFKDAPIPDVPAEQPLEKLSPIMDADLSFESLVSPDIPTQPKRKHEKLIIDEIYSIPRSEMISRINNIKIMTRPRDIVNIDRIRFDAQLLFTKPSTSRRGRSIIDCSNAIKSLFKLNIKHKFHIDTDKSLFPEKIRYPETSEKTVELSSGDSRRHEQTNEPLVKDISDPIANVDGIIPLGETGHNLLNEIVDTRSIMEPTIHSDLITVGDQTYVIPTDNTLRIGDDSSSFLPENVDKSPGCRQSTATTEKIIDISSKSSPDSSIFYERSIEDMCNNLKRLWREKNGPINFKYLFVPAEITEFEVACSLWHLLHLAKNNQIELQQAEPYEIIWIYLS